MPKHQELPELTDAQREWLRKHARPMRRDEDIAWFNRLRVMLNDRGEVDDGHDRPDGQGG